MKSPLPNAAFHLGVHEPSTLGSTLLVRSRPALRCLSVKLLFLGGGSFRIFSLGKEKAHWPLKNLNCISATLDFQLAPLAKEIWHRRLEATCIHFCHESQRSTT